MKKFNNLRKWLKLDKDDLRMYENGSRGLYSIKDIKNGDIIMKIPQKYIIQFSIIDKNDFSHNMNLYNTNSFVASHLLTNELKKKSFIDPYLETMPESLDEYIYYYDKKKLNQLKNTSMMCDGSYSYNEHIENIKNDAKILYKMLLQKNLLPDKYKVYKNFFKIFLKYRILVCSRIFGYTRNYQSENGMVPYADLLNHSENPNTTWYFDDTKNSFIVKATKNIKKNTEIYDSYGDKTNKELMMYYGFTIPNNKHSELNIMHKNNLFQFKNNSVIDESDYKKELVNKLKKILESHTKKLNKTYEFQDENIKNIYKDEISIIKKVLSISHKG